MWCVRVLSGVVMLFVLFSATPAVADVTITHTGTVTLPVYLKSEAPLARACLMWLPGEPVRFREEPALPLLTAAHPDPYVDCMGERPIGWRLEVGTLDGLDWVAVLNQLRDDFDVEIGKKVCCRTVGWVKPIDGYCCKIALYPRYMMEFFRVQEGLNTWVVSVVTPCEGVARVFSEVSSNGQNGDGAMAVQGGFPASAMGTCVSMGITPFVGGECDFESGSSGKDPRIKIEPQRTARYETTWGTIKALFEEQDRR